MSILAVDATGEILSAALEVHGGVFVVRKTGPRPHDELLLPVVESLFRRARISWKDLDAVVAAAGPGRFTGIRVGLAFAAMAGLKLGKPALALSRLEAVAQKCGADDVLAALPGWRGEIYHQRFQLKKSGLVAAGAAEWTASQFWPRRKAQAEARGLVVFCEDVGAVDLLPVARRRIALKDFPPFSPFYLKPAGYERKPVR